LLNLGKAVEKGKEEGWHFGCCHDPFDPLPLHTALLSLRFLYYSHTIERSSHPQFQSTFNFLDRPLLEMTNDNDYNN